MYRRGLHHDIIHTSSAFSSKPRQVESSPNDLALSKSQSELLGSRLQQWNLLHSSTRITAVRHRQQDLSQFFAMEGSLCYCRNVNDLFESLGLAHDSTEWRLFIDGSKFSLKGVLLHNGNEQTSIPVNMQST
jgi:hypothetical protein